MNKNIQSHQHLLTNYGSKQNIANAQITNSIYKNSPHREKSLAALDKEDLYE